MSRAAQAEALGYEGFVRVRQFDRSVRRAVERNTRSQESDDDEPMSLGTSPAMGDEGFAGIRQISRSVRRAMERNARSQAAEFAHRRGMSLQDVRIRTETPQIPRNQTLQVVSSFTEAVRNLMRRTGAEESEDARTRTPRSEVDRQTEEDTTDEDRRSVSSQWSPSNGMSFGRNQGIRAPVLFRKRLPERT